MTPDPLMRWNIENPHSDEDVGMLTDVNGRWVLFDDTEQLRTRLAQAEEHIKELEVAKYPGCRVLSLGSACPCKICQLEAQLATVTTERDREIGLRVLSEKFRAQDAANACEDIAHLARRHQKALAASQQEGARLRKVLARLAGPMDRSTNIYTVQSIAKEALSGEAQAVEENP